MGTNAYANAQGRAVLCSDREADTSAQPLPIPNPELNHSANDCRYNQKAPGEPGESLLSVGFRSQGVVE